MPSTIIDCLVRNASEQPNKKVYTFVDRNFNEKILTNFELLNGSKKIANRLLQSPKSPCIVLIPKSTDFLYGFFGCLISGRLAVPTPAPKRGELTARIRSVFEASGAKTIVTTDLIYRKICGNSESSSFLKEVDWVIVDDCLTQTLDDFSGQLPVASDLAFLQFTSGSLGVPKGVMVSHDNLVHNHQFMKDTFQIQTNSVDVSWLPAHHDMGLIQGLLQSVYSGARSIQIDPLEFIVRPRIWFDVITRYKAQTTGGPNFAYELICRRADEAWLNSIDLHSMNVFYNGAEPVNPNTLRKFTSTFEKVGGNGSKLMPCFGMAESTLAISFSGYGTIPKTHVDRDGHEHVCLGKPQRASKIIIVDPLNGDLMEPGRIGEIWVKGRSVTQGYWKQTEATRKTFNQTINGEDGYLRTGDMGYLIDGELYFTGRLKNIIIKNGVNIFPEDIELTIGKITEIIQNGVVVFSKFVDHKDEVYVVAELTRNELENPEIVTKVNRIINKTILGEFGFTPDHVHLVRRGFIPKTTSGKNVRDKLVEKLETQEIGKEHTNTK